MEANFYLLIKKICLVGCVVGHQINAIFVLISSLLDLKEDLVSICVDYRVSQKKRGAFGRL